MDAVRGQYEAYPYPTRDPSDERRRLLFGFLDLLPLLNHNCFGGRRDFREPFRVLVAGGGTGDSTIFLAEQLAGTDAEVVHLDLSGASIAIAKERARVRGLDRIRWVNRSLLDLGELGFGKFDYINCGGVLHHLDDPGAGLASLVGSLADDGAMGLMLYGAHGRTAITQVRDLLGLVDGESTDLAARIETAKAVLQTLPDTNWFSLTPGLVNDGTHDDAGIVDMFLHARERTYTVPEVYELVADAGLELVAFTEDRHLYSPELYFRNRDQRDRDLARRVASQPLAVRQAIGELLTSQALKHTFHCSRRRGCTAKLDDESMVPFLWSKKTHLEASAELSTEGRTAFGSEQAKLHIGRTDFNASIFELMDGRRTVREILDGVLEKTGAGADRRPEVFAQLSKIQSLLAYSNEMLLRHESLPLFPTGSELQARAETRMGRS